LTTTAAATTNTMSNNHTLTILRTLFLLAIFSLAPVARAYDCDICRGQGRPTDKSMVINVLYLGQFTCDQYYAFGRQGKLPQDMCATIQFFAFGPCGCGKSTTTTVQQAPSRPTYSTPTTSSSTLSGFKRKNANNSDGKDTAKLSNTRGGSGAGGGRALKGSIVV